VGRLREARGGLEASLGENQGRRLAELTASLEGFGEKLKALVDKHGKEASDQIAQMTKGTLDSLSKTMGEVQDQMRRTATARMAREVEALEANYQQALKEQSSATQKQIYEIVEVATEEGRAELDKALRERLARVLRSASPPHEPWSADKQGSVIKGSIPAGDKYGKPEERFQTTQLRGRELTLPKFAVMALLCLVAVTPPTIAFLLSAQQTMRLRADPPPDFIDSSPDWSPERIQNEKELAREYWQLAVHIVQAEYKYGEDLPVEPPADFHLIEDSRDKRGRTDGEARERYWDKLRQAWGRRESWERIYEWNTEWIYRLLPSLRY
jgi:hypothetical protein